MELFATFIDLLLTREDLHVLVWVNKETQVVDTAEMKGAHCVKIIVKQVHFLDEFWDELDKRVQLVTDFPASFSYDLVEKVSPVCDGQHRMGELGVTEDLWVTEWILV